MLITSSLTACVRINQDSRTNANSLTANSPIEIKVVVVTMFEIGKDTGDKAGEFQLWKEGQKLDTRFAFPQGHYDIYVNTDTGVMGIVTGMGTAKATAAIMALGLDPRFNFSHSYWLIAGIAGVDPQDISVGSAIWAEWLVDGDLAHEIDAREIPKNWQSGYFPLFSNQPFPSGSKAQQSLNGEVYQLNQQLVHWAYTLTKDEILPDYPSMQTLRARYIDFPKAQRPPSIIIGDQLAASTFWHGKLMNAWANDWVSYWTKDKGNFVTSGMEDTGSYQAISYLHNAGLADKERMLVLRTASNYSMQPEGLSAAQNLSLESSEEGFAGLRGSIESAYIVGSKVVDTLVENWSTYGTQLPGE